MSLYREIFEGALETIITNARYPRETVLNRFERFNHFDFEKLDDKRLFQILAWIPFFANVKSTIVAAKNETIMACFPDYSTVARYRADDLERICDALSSIRHPRRKIEAVYANARMVERLVSQHGSFKAFLRSLNFNRSAQDLERAAKILSRLFKYLGPVTVHHFLTEIGANTIKPDLVIMREFTRLGLVKDETCIDEARRVCNHVAEETGLSHRYVDIVLVKLGHMGDDLDIGFPKGICLERNPQCNQCLLLNHCPFGRNMSMDRT
jgi:DNA-3-methyladenine glycosylase I